MPPRRGTLDVGDGRREKIWSPTVVRKRPAIAAPIDEPEQKKKGEAKKAAKVEPKKKAATKAAAKVQPKPKKKLTKTEKNEDADDADSFGAWSDSFSGVEVMDDTMIPF